MDCVPVTLLCLQRRCFQIDIVWERTLARQAELRGHPPTSCNRFSYNQKHSVRRRLMAQVATGINKLIQWSFLFHSLEQLALRKELATSKVNFCLNEFLFVVFLDKIVVFSAAEDFALFKTHNRFAHSIFGSRNRVKFAVAVRKGNRTIYVF